MGSAGGGFFISWERRNSVLNVCFLLSSRVRYKFYLTSDYENRKLHSFPPRGAHATGDSERKKKN